MTENHSFGCIEDRIAMGLYDFSEAKVYQKPEKINEEELFCKLFPEYVVNGKPLSPYFDLFKSGYEKAEEKLKYCGNCKWNDLEGKLVHSPCIECNWDLDKWEIKEK